MKQSVFFFFLVANIFQLHFKFRNTLFVDNSLFNGFWTSPNYIIIEVQMKIKFFVSWILDDRLKGRKNIGWKTEGQNNWSKYILFRKSKKSIMLVSQWISYMGKALAQVIMLNTMKTVNKVSRSIPSIFHNSEY